MGAATTSRAPDPTTLSLSADAGTQAPGIALTRNLSHARLFCGDWQKSMQQATCGAAPRRAHKHTPAGTMYARSLVSREGTIAAAAVHRGHSHHPAAREASDLYSRARRYLGRYW